MSDVQVAWVAGLLEGEGSFQLRDKRLGMQAIVTIRCSMTDLDVINKLADTIDGGSVNQAGYSNGQNDFGDYKRIYAWQMSRRNDVSRLLTLIYTHMGERRRVKIDEIMLYLKDNPNRVSRAKPMVHGTLNAYVHHSCRCDLCRTKGTEVRRANKERKAAVGSSLG